MPLAHTRRGAGDALLLVHGTGASKATWEPVIGALAERHEVVAVDMPGFGDSAPLPAQIRPGVGALAGAVAEFAVEAGLGRPHLAGHSLGGGVGLELARRGCVRTLTALSPVGFWTPRESAWCRHSLVAARRLARHGAPLVEWLAATPTGRRAALWQHMARGDRVPAEVAVAWTRGLAEAADFDRVNDTANRECFGGGEEIVVPVTIAWAQRDRILLPRQAQRARRALPRARHLTLTGCGHTPFYDDPEQVTRVLLEGASRGGD